MAKRTDWKAKYEALKAEHELHRLRIADADPDAMSIAAWAKAHEHVVNQREALQAAIEQAFVAASQGNVSAALTILRNALTLLRQEIFQ